MRSVSVILLWSLFIENFSFINTSVQRRITHGTNPPSFSYPYTTQARLYLITPKNVPYLCTGTIISDLVVLTAAHCVEGKDRLFVLYNKFTVRGLSYILSKKWYIHPDYKIKNLDLALIVAQESMKLNDKVQAAYPERWIINPEDLRVHSRPSLMCGWGVTEKKRLSDSVKCLKYTKLDQECLNPEEDASFSWCFSSPPSPDGKNDTWSNACSGDSGAGIFPGN